MSKDRLIDKAAEMWQRNARVMESLVNIVDPDQYEATFQAILNCKGKVVTLGMGTSSVAARKIAHMLCVANVPAFFASPGDCAHGAFGAVQKDDLLIILSKGGNTEELVNLIPSIHEKGIKMIAVTANMESQLAKAADIVLYIDVEESDHKRTLPTASILSIISMFDAIADELTNYPQFSEKTFYYNHTHGAVGAMLKENLNK